MNYVFEKYEIGDKGRIFLGYITVKANSNEEAAEIAQAKVSDGVTLAQIWVPQ